MMQNRLRSKLLWLSLASLVSFVLKTYFDVKIEGYDTFVELSLGFLATVGIINNPERNDSL